MRRPKAVLFGILLCCVSVLFNSYIGSAAAEHAPWDCTNPACGRKGNTGKYCGSCSQPAPWLNEAVTAGQADGLDLSSMSFDELVALKDKINLAIWNSQEWQEVKVPAGLYKVGEDIPAGKWTVLAPDGTYNLVKWGTKPDASGTQLEHNDGSTFIYSTSYESFNPDNDRSQLDIELLDGMYFYVDYGVAIFTPYKGKPDLGFK